MATGRVSVLGTEYSILRSQFSVRHCNLQRRTENGERRIAARTADRARRSLAAKRSARIGQIHVRADGAAGVGEGDAGAQPGLAVHAGHEAPSRLVVGELEVLA